VELKRERFGEQMNCKKIFKSLVRGYRIVERENREKLAERMAESMQAASNVSSTSPALSAPAPVITIINNPASPQQPAQTALQPSVEVKAVGEERKGGVIERKVEGFEIPDFKQKTVKLGEMRPEEAKIMPMVYPLIPSKPKKDEPVFAYAKIFWDDKLHKYNYQVVEPDLSPKLTEILGKVKDLLEQRLDVDFSKLKRFEASEYLSNQVDELLQYFDFRVDESEKKILRYYVERDFMGLGKIEPLIRDDNIEDISCDGVGIPIFIFHRNAKLGSTISNVFYNNPEELDSFVTRLSQLCGKSISVTDPLVDGTLPDGSRLQATLATDIARRGSNFTIRKFTETPLTPIHLLNYGTIDVKTLAYLWFVVDNGCSILVCGGTASGKTTLLNVLSLFIRPDKKIVSIEDTAELQLPHPHWIPTVARTSISELGEKAKGEVDLFDLLKESMRQRPDYIIVGEVRGPEAYILFQQMATGHPSLATIHAENMPKLMDRLTTPPISLPPGLIGSLDLVVFLARMKYKEKFLRRVTEAIEMVEYDLDKKAPVINRVFKWNSQNDKFEASSKSVMLKKIADRNGLKEQEVKDELERRMMVLNWMSNNNVLDYRDVNKILNMYYNYPQRTISMIMERM